MNEQYAALTYAVHGGVLSAAALGDTSSIITDDIATDDDLNAAFDRHNLDYPWSA